MVPTSTLSWVMFTAGADGGAGGGDSLAGACNVELLQAVTKRPVLNAAMISAAGPGRIIESCPP